MGLFISIEGPEGSGKTTVAKKVTEKLEEEGYKVLYTREPGGVEIAEKIRDIILDVKNTNLDPKSEALLYAASRRQHLVEKVEPALKKGYIIICDRFVDSSLAYQGAARGLGIDKVYALNQFATDGLLPDLTIVFDLDPEEGLHRISCNKNREVNRLDKEKLAFHKKVREAFLYLHKTYPDRVRIIDASKDPDEVYKEALKEIHNVLRSR